MVELTDMTLEQRRKVFESFIDSETFNNIVDSITKCKMSYYTWLQKYIAKGSEDKSEESINRGIEHIYKCMLLDNYVECCNTSVVYFIKNKYTGLIKIGRTTNLTKRIQELKNCFTLLGMNPQELELEAIIYCPFGMSNSQVESHYHNVFEEYRIIGEWFQIDRNMLTDELDIDMLVNNIIVTVADPRMFSKGVKKLKLLESNENKLIQQVRNELYDEYASCLCIHDNSWIWRVFSDYISAKTMYDYILTLESSDDLYIEPKIANIVENIINNATIK